MAKKQTEQPAGILWACILIWAGAGITLLGAFLTLVLSVALGDIGVAGLGASLVAASILPILLALIMIVVGIALWYHNTVAWWIATILTGLGLLGSITTIFSISIWWFVSLVLTVLTLLALIDKKSIKACKIKGWKGIETIFS